tara:strand:+ start:1307 stop:1420 length:114 start_codon:yes stop_codon:yes gene_type:complete
MSLTKSMVKVKPKKIKDGDAKVRSLRFFEVALLAHGE